MKGGIGNLMKQAQKMQEDMQKAQADVANLEVEAESGGGMVKLLMTGQHQCKRVTIDPTVMEDKEMLEDLIAAAINDGAKKVDQATKEKMAGVTAGMNLPAGMKLPF